MFLFFLLIIPVRPNVGRPATNQRAQASQTTTSTSQPSVEQDRLALERQKHSDEIALKRDELSIRREELADQQSQRRLTILSTVIPLLAVLFTIGYNAWLFRKQTDQSDQQRTEDAKLQFELKAAEIAFGGDTPLAVRDRAKALKTMFSKRLLDTFLTDYDPIEFGEREANVESKKFFLELLLRYPDPKQQFETLCFWKELFPGDVDWLHRVTLSPHDLPRKDPVPPKAVGSNPSLPQT